jgi:hypothetical protein
VFVKILIFFIAQTGHISQCSTYVMLLLTLGTALQHQLQLIVAATMLLPLLMTSLSKPMIAFVCVYLVYHPEEQTRQGSPLRQSSQPTRSPKNGGNNFFALLLYAQVSSYAGRWGQFRDSECLFQPIATLPDHPDYVAFPRLQPRNRNETTSTARSNQSPTIRR